jgi:hypothetical protein
MPWLVNCDGKLVEMPFDGDWIVDDLEGRLPNEVMFTMDERKFECSFEEAIWTHGEGEYATLAYCRELTIMRHATLDRAIESKRMIDGGGCGGGCMRMHVIIRIDPTNSRYHREQENIRRYIEETEQ